MAGATLDANDLRQRSGPGRGKVNKVTTSLDTPCGLAMNKIFGIGLSRTGTKSLAAALNVLQIKTIWYPQDQQTFAELAIGKYELSVLQYYDGATDTPIAPFYPQLDQIYPGSKFILTIRDPDDWLKSCAKHWMSLPVAVPLPPDAPVWQQFAFFISTAVYGTCGFNGARFRYVYQSHLASVRRYFEGREDDLLTMDIAAGDGWERLCQFLDRPVPNRPFPHVNAFDDPLLR